VNFADCCTNELEFRICTICKKIQYKVYIQFETVFRQRLLASIIFFITKAFIGGYYYFWTFNISVMITSSQSNLTRDRIAATGASFDRFRQVAPTCTCSSNARCFEPKGAPRPLLRSPRDRLSCFCRAHVDRQNK